MSDGFSTDAQRTVQYVVQWQQENVQAVNDARQQIDNLKAAAASLDDQLNSGYISRRQYDAGMKGYNAEIRQAQKELKGLEQAVVSAVTSTDRIGNSLDATGKRSGAAARGVLELSRGLEDLTTGGPLGILNNIPGIFQNLGQAAGLAGPQVAVLTTGVGLLGTAAYVLYKNWDLVVGTDPGLRAFFKTLGENLNPFHVETYGAAIEKLTDRIKELEGQKVRLAVDARELDLAKQKVDEFNEAWQAYQASVTGKSEAQRKSGQAVEQILAEAAGGEPAITESLANQFGRQLYETSTDKRELDERSRRNQNRLDYAKKQGTYDKEIQDRFDKENQAILNERNKLINTFILSRDPDKPARGKVEVGAILDSAKKGDTDAIEQLANLMGNRKGGNPLDVLGYVGPTDLASQLRAVTPNNIRDEMENDRQVAARKAQFDAEQKRIKEQAEARKKAEKETDELNQQGIENQVAAEEAAQRAKAKASAAHDRAVAEAARTNAPAVEGKNNDLTVGVNVQLGEGMSPDEIVKRASEEAARRLAKVPGIDPAIVADTAERIIRNVIERQAPKIVAAGGGAGAAAQLNADIAGKNFDAANRNLTADRRRELQSVENMAADRFAAQGANVNQALALGHETAKLFQGGLDFDRAMLQAFLNLTGQTRVWQQQQVQMNRQLQQAMRQAGRRPGGNWRPGRTQ